MAALPDSRTTERFHHCAIDGTGLESGRRWREWRRRADHTDPGNPSEGPEPHEHARESAGLDVVRKSGPEDSDAILAGEIYQAHHSAKAGLHRTSCSADLTERGTHWDTNELQAVSYFALGVYLRA